MLKRISALKARQNLGQVMNEVSLEKHLINLRTFRGIRITDPGHLLKIVGEKA